MAKNPIEGPQRLKKNLTANTPPRVAPRLKSEVKRMRVRSKKNSLGGRK